MLNLTQIGPTIFLLKEFKVCLIPSTVIGANVIAAPSTIFGAYALQIVFSVK